MWVPNLKWSQPFIKTAQIEPKEEKPPHTTRMATANNPNKAGLWRSDSAHAGGRRVVWPLWRGTHTSVYSWVHRTGSRVPEDTAHTSTARCSQQPEGGGSRQQLRR